MMEKKLTVGVVGLSMGRRYLSASIENGAEIGAICDSNEAVLNEKGDQFQIPADKRFTDWHALLHMDELNVIAIATPDQLHREMAEAFLAAGKHVICEKPLALTREDLVAIIKAADNAKAKFMVGQVARFNPSKSKIKELADSGMIGEIFYLENEYAHDYAKILSANGWRSDPIRHGVVGGGCHAVDMLRWLAGDPTEVFAYGNHKMLPQVSYDDATIAVLKFPNDVIGKVFVSTGCKRPYTSRTLVYGTRGTIVWEDTHPEDVLVYTVDEDGISLKPEPEIIKIVMKDHNVTKEFEVFAEHIRKDTPVLLSALEGAKTVAVCHAIVESSQTGKPVAPDYNF
ncbi:MAG: Gfo/Idh/MocA family oxidoreductase [Clostridia bacterium]|nr:Gfo/Idh/MocA family oxidoreductase [Clostridia bacterium]